MGGWYLLVYNYSFNRLKINMIHGILINRPNIVSPLIRSQDSLIANFSAWNHLMSYTFCVVIVTKGGNF